MFSKTWTQPSTAVSSDPIEQLKGALASADAVVVGAGAGLSASAGMTYSGERFRRYFSDFQSRYDIQDMYSGGFYPFESLEEYWAWWSRQILVNRYEKAPKPVYGDLLKLIKDKDYFVLTTNVDHQSGWPVFRMSVYLQPRETTGCSSANRHAIRNCMTMRRRSGPC